MLLRDSKSSCYTQGMALATRDIDGVEVFSSGRHNGHEYTNADLDDIATAYADISKRLGYDPPIKLDHDEEQASLGDTPKDGGPAFGWVANVRRKGAKLLADFKAVPEKLAELIEAGAYRARSAEIWWDVELEGTIYRRALKAVALLGVKMPAVKKLKDIFKLYDGQEAALTHDDERSADFDAVWYFDDDADDELSEEELAAMMGTLTKKLEPIIRNKTGAPRTRGFLKDLDERIRAFMAKRHMPGTPKAQEHSTLLFKTDVNYREGGTVGNRCSDCRWYSNWNPGYGSGSCSLVEGVILNSDLCDRFEAQPKTYEGDGTSQTEQVAPKAQGSEPAKEGTVADKTMTAEEYDSLQAQLAEAKAHAAKVDEMAAEHKAAMERVDQLEHANTQRWASDTVTTWYGDQESNRDFLLEAVKLHGRDSDFVRKLIDRETASAKRTREGALLTEAGHGQTPVLGGIAEKLETAIAEALEKGLAKTRVEAIGHVARTNPKLYREYSESTVGAKMTYPMASE